MTFIVIVTATTMATTMITTVMATKVMTVNEDGDDN